MSEARTQRSALLRATIVGAALQLAMVLTGHVVPAVANLFGLLGVAISFLAGWLFVHWAPALETRSAAVGGALAGAACAAIGIVVSFALGDVTAVILLVGTASSAVTGLLGGLLANRGRREAAASG